MIATPDLPSVITSAATERKLGPRNDLGVPGWMFWELRTLNMHRVVGLLHEYQEFADALDLEATVRGVVSRNFKSSWWRGMAYGVVAEVAVGSLSVDDLKILIDIRENAKGTLQWIILVSSDTRIALGVHTWMEAYLSPMYRNALHALEMKGYQVSSARKEKDGLMRFLTGVADLNAAFRSFGTRKHVFPQFRNDLRRDP